MDMMTLLAMAPPPSSAGGSTQQSPYFMIGWLVIMMAIFYMLFMRPQQRREKERRAMLEGIRSGDRVIFSGGIIGIVTNVKEKTFVIKVADNVKVEVIRGAVSRVIEKGGQPPESVE